jgi:hypothetical protein
MNRTTTPNPQNSAYQIVRCQLNDVEFPSWATDTGLANMPAGYRGFCRIAGNVMEFGIEKIAEGVTGAVPVPQGDNLEGKSIADLRTLCGRKGIAYKPEDNETVLMQALRAKGKK